MLIILSSRESIICNYECRDRFMLVLLLLFAYFILEAGALGLVVDYTLLLTLFKTVLFLFVYSERGAGDWSSDGERETQESAQAAYHLLQLPARGATAALPKGAVPRAPGESWTGCTARLNTDTGTHAHKHISQLNTTGSPNLIS